MRRYRTCFVDSRSSNVLERTYTRIFFPFENPLSDFSFPSTCLSVLSSYIFYRVCGIFGILWNQTFVQPRRSYSRKPVAILNLVFFQVTYNRVMSNHRSVTKPKDVKYKRINKAKSKSLEELRGRLRNWVEKGNKIAISLDQSYAWISTFWKYIIQIVGNGDRDRSIVRRRARGNLERQRCGGRRRDRSPLYI